MKKIIIKKKPNSKYDSYKLVPVTEQDIKKAKDKAKPWEWFDDGKLRPDIIISSSGGGIMLDLEGLLVPDNVTKIAVRVDKCYISQQDGDKIRPSRVWFAEVTTRMATYSPSRSCTDLVKSTKGDWERNSTIHIDVSMFGVNFARSNQGTRFTAYNWSCVRKYTFNNDTRSWAAEVW